MIDHSAPMSQDTKHRIVCPTTGKLVATADKQGISVWCMYEKKPELVAWNRLPEQVLRDIVCEIQMVLAAMTNAGNKDVPSI